MNTTIGLRQLQRLLGLPGADAASLARTIREDPARLADALFEESVASDDVTSAESAVDYLDARLAELAGLVPEEAGGAVRAEFVARTAAW